MFGVSKHFSKRCTIFVMLVNKHTKNVGKSLDGQGEVRGSQKMKAARFPIDNSEV
jgi:hypothetical protein